ATNVGTATVTQPSSQAPSSEARYTPDPKAMRRDGPPIAGRRLHTRVHSRASSYDAARRRYRELSHSSASAANTPMTADTSTNNTGRYRFMRASPQVVITAPPATSRTTPVIQPLAGDARNKAARATSSGDPRRFSG